MADSKIPINFKTLVPRYSIYIGAGNTISALEKLEKFGFVFTEQRLKSSDKDKIFATWAGVSVWSHISTGDSYDACWMILHARVGGGSDDMFGIGLDDFLEKVAPNWTKVNA